MPFAAFVAPPIASLALSKSGTVAFVPFSLAQAAAIAACVSSMSDLMLVLVGAVATALTVGPSSVFSSVTFMVEQPASNSAIAETARTSAQRMVFPPFLGARRRGGRNVNIAPAGQWVRALRRRRPSKVTSGLQSGQTAPIGAWVLSKPVFAVDVQRSVGGCRVTSPSASDASGEDRAGNTRFAWRNAPVESRLSDAQPAGLGDSGPGWFAESGRDGLKSSGDPGAHAGPFDRQRPKAAG